MLKNLIVLFCSVSWICLTGCNIRTPEIRGVVLDEETKQPVEGAWVTATLELKTKTIQGDVYNTLSIDKPHTRTDKDGIFLVHSKRFKRPLPPEGFGTEIESFDISAKTLDRIGGVRVDSRDLGKKKTEVRIYIRSIEKIYEEAFQKYLSEGMTKEKASELIERDHFSSLQSLSRYCFSGRFSVEVPPVEKGCDEWELNFAIAKHERYLEKYPMREQIRSHHTIILEQLGLLYEKKGKLEKAIEYLKKAKEIRFFRPQDLQNDIDRIQEKIKEGRK